jgi:haloacetate dehalogenase
MDQKGEHVNHRRAIVNGIKIHYVEAGKGPPVFLLHGFPEAWFAWRKQIPVLSKRYRVIVPDFRGYGDSEKPQSGYDKRTMARDVQALMNDLEIDRAAIIGHDRGQEWQPGLPKIIRMQLDASLFSITFRPA